MLIPYEGTEPTYAHHGDAGADLRASATTTIKGGRISVIGTGVRVAVPPGFVGILAGRSGLSINRGVALANGIGVIDSGYRGELKVGLVNHNGHEVVIEEGERIAQLLIMPVMHATFAQVDMEEYANTERGEGGFGSSGRI